MQPGRSYLVSSEQVVDGYIQKVPKIDRLIFDASTAELKAVRALISQALQQPFGEVRLTVIQNAEKLSEAAQNTLLKLLEEPPLFLVIIVVASRVDALLPTVRSRLHRFGGLQRLTTNSSSAPVDRADIERGIATVKDRSGLVAFFESTREQLLTTLLNEPSALIADRIDLLDRSIRRLGQNVNQKLVVDTLLLNWPSQSSRSEVGTK